MPDWDKVSQIRFSARDEDQCAELIARVLGFRVFDEVVGADRRGVLLLRAGSITVTGLQQHDQNQGEEFDPRRPGLDHIGFKGSSPHVLKQWEEHFEALNIDYTPIVDRHYGLGFTFRGPEGHRSEMFYRRSAAGAGHRDAQHALRPASAQTLMGA